MTLKKSVPEILNSLGQAITIVGLGGGLSYLMSGIIYPDEFEEKLCIYKGMESRLNQAYPDLQNDKFLRSKQILIREAYLSGEIPEGHTSSELEQIANQGKSTKEKVQFACSKDPYMRW